MRDEEQEIVVVMPWGEVRRGCYRWLKYGEPGADGMTLRITKWTPISETDPGSDEHD